MHFVYSGNFMAETELCQFDNLRMTMGINPEEFSWLLTPGEERAKLVDINDKAEAKPYTYFTETGTKADPPRKKIEEDEGAEEVQ